MSLASTVPVYSAPHPKCSFFRLSRSPWRLHNRILCLCSWFSFKLFVLKIKKKKKEKENWAPPLPFACWGERRIPASSFSPLGPRDAHSLLEVTQECRSQDPGLGLLIQCSAPPWLQGQRPAPCPCICASWLCPFGLGGAEEVRLVFPQAYYILGTLPSQTHRILSASL